MSNSSCQKCPLHIGVRNVQIGGRGSENPKFLFCGQNPGQEEDEAGLPFVGESGKLLTKLIQQFDLRPARLTNAARCASPGNRKPTRKELIACKPYLLEEIKKVKPEYVVAVGDVALSTLTGKRGIMDYAGRIVGDLEGSKVFAVIHPAYILRAPKAIYKLEAQLKELKRLSLHGEKKTKVKFELVSPGKAMDWVHAFPQTRGRSAKGKFITIDFETNGKHKGFGGLIRCLGLSDGKETLVVNAADYGFKDLLEAFTKNGVHLCAHNSVFERRWFIDEIGKEPLGLIYDTMLIDYLVFEERPHDLSSTAGYWLEDAPPWKIEFLMREKGWTWGSVPDNVLFEYCALDALITHRIMEKQIAYLIMSEEHRAIRKYYMEVLSKTTMMCARYESRGFAVDKDWCKSVQEKYKKEMFRLGLHMTQLANETEFSPDSPQQVSAIFKKLGIKTEVTSMGHMSVSKKALEKVKERHPFLEAYSKYKRLAGLENNYLKKFPALADINGIIHPSYNPAFQVTGRISAIEPPATNIPREPEIRGMVVSRWSAQGGKVLSFDYRQLEMRLVASEAGEQGMLKIFQEGKDVHDETAQKMFGAGFTKELRAIAKNINFGTVYGISPYSLSDKFNVPVRKSEDFIRLHKETFPQIYNWMEEQHKFIKANGYSASRLGQRRHFPGWKEAGDYERARILRQAGNFPIQHLGAALTHLAAFKVDQTLTESFKSILFHEVHDCVLIDLHPAEAGSKFLFNFIGEIMTNLIPRKYAPFLRVALPVEGRIADRWGA